MPRINIKGGVWRNTEDEILKAAVMKYGKNQWARIASLLHRKSAKQCKARWYEWLDPSVKKTEWSREEDEKLLHLAKLLPTQWRTIAPIVGRTANQCLERYEYLLDKAQNIDMSTNRDDPRRLRPGEIDPSPETKPARPDPVDMDEDELEMLSEARARLANTQGKKAKRKARERQLEIARRMAMMQKRRELRAAGLASAVPPLVNKKVFIDYNREIPFEKQPPKGFHDTSREFPDPKPINFDRLRLSDVEKESYMEREKLERKKDAERQKKRMESDLPGALLSREKGDEPIIKRSKLVLPAPQISDLELENLVKVGQAGENAMRMALEDSRDTAGGATQALLTEYHRGSLGGPDSAFATPLHLLAKTPLPASDNLILEAQSIIALQQVQTPLKGGENTTLPTGTVQVVGTTPKPQHLPTPNILLPGQLAATPFRTPDVGAGVGVTPTPGIPDGASIGVTPRRDYLNINANDRIEGELNPQQTVTNLRETLASLPQPKNNFEISMPDEGQLNDLESVDLDAEAAASGTAAKIADQADLDKQTEKEREAAAAAAWSRRSQALQRSLPRPTAVNRSVLRPPTTSDMSLTDLQKSEELIKKEMLVMLHFDNLHNPPPALLTDITRTSDGKLLSAAAQQKRLQQLNATHEAHLKEAPFEDFADEDLAEASEYIREEIAVVRAGMGHGDLSTEAYAKVWDECLAQVLYLPQHRRYTRANLVSKADRIESAEKRLEQLRGKLAEEAQKAFKQEKKLGVLLGGYQSRAQGLIKAIQDSVDLTEQSRMEFTTLERLREQELGAIARRTELLKIDVERQRAREAELQKEFARLVRMKEEREADQLIMFGAQKQQQEASYADAQTSTNGVEDSHSEAENHHQLQSPPSPPHDTSSSPEDVAEASDRGGWTTIQLGDSAEPAPSDTLSHHQPSEVPAAS
uniref:Cell division cycle 5-like protein n=1 Tax=Schistocephalus solidus TaxID=70667 RepID=A0A0V0J3I9_SCHSO